MRRWIGFILLGTLIAACSGSRYGIPKGESITIYRGDAPVQIGFSDLVEDLAGADAVFVGEIHTDSLTHVLQRLLLEALYEKGVRPAVAMEMFERDVQTVLDAYLAGEVTEGDFLKRSRPWRNYQTDYRPLVEFAREKGLPVLAMNVPGRYARRIAMQGESFMKSVPDSEKVWLADRLKPLEDEYKVRFMELMKNRPPSPMSHLDPEKMYLAQVLRDDTMAETLFRFIQDHSGTPVFSCQGDFHSAYGLGIVKKLRLLEPSLDCRVISAVPVENPDSVRWEDHEGRGDYLIFVPKKEDGNQT
ncbi:MAG TPA: hypothetical protein ENN03_01605 [bacterium]|nr:hypothetical protein [bacterium]